MSFLKKFNVLFVVFLISSLNVSADFAGGDGSLASPYQITNASNLQLIINNTGANFSLQNNIDASETLSWNGGAGFDSIGNQTSGFYGTFFGNGYFISNLWINRSNESTTGLFGSASVSSTVYGRFYDITLTNATIYGGNYTGGLVGYGPYIVINNSHVSGNVSGGNYTGGLLVL